LFRALKGGIPNKILSTVWPPNFFASPKFLGW